MNRPAAEKPDLREQARGRDGQTRYCDRRLFIQFLAFGGCGDSAAITQALARSTVTGVVYEDINDPKGIAVLALHEDPDYFVTDWRRLLNQAPFSNLTPKPDYTMFGRTYAIGFEPDLEQWLLEKPKQTALNPDWPWAVWYPLRRSGQFIKLSEQEQRQILMEHAVIGRSFGEADYVHDIRLACHGLDRNDNDFVIGLTGSKLHPLSAIVQAMRKTTQTSQYLEKLGPFFVGKAVWQAPLKSQSAS